MECHNLTEVADWYLDDEPTVEDNHDLRHVELRAHLEGCAECRRELAARREVRTMLKRAVTQSPDFRVRPEFAFQLRNNLQATLQMPERKSVFANLFAPILSARPRWLAVAACLLIVVMVGFVALISRRTPTHLQTVGVESRDANPAQLDGAAVGLARFEKTKNAVGDHRFCALDYQLEEEPIPLDEAGRRFDAAYTDLEEAVMSGQGGTADDIRLVEEHSCVYNDQRFAHVVLERKGQTISVLVTGKPQDDSTLVSNANVTAADNQAIACAQIDGYQVACFETKRHAVYTISALSEADNLAVARSISSSVSAHINRAEKIA